MSGAELLKIDENIKESTFSRRRSLVKYYVQKKLKDSDELGETAGTNGKTGYFEISTIVNAMNDELIKYNLDLDIIITKDEILCVWIDTTKDSDNEFSHEISINGLDTNKKLPSMVNEIQSRGAIITYLRRYGLVSCLGLQATDKIENNSAGEWKNKQQNNNNSYNNKITEKEVKFIFGKAKEFNYSKELIIKLIGKHFKVSKVEDLNRNQKEDLIKKMQANPMKNEAKKI